MSEKKLIILPDDDSFTESSCKCANCTSMNTHILQWNTLQPKTNLQKRMKDVIDKIETRERKKLKIEN